MHDQDAYGCAPHGYEDDENENDSCEISTYVKGLFPIACKDDSNIIEMIHMNNYSYFHLRTSCGSSGSPHMH